MERAVSFEPLEKVAWELMQELWPGAKNAYLLRAGLYILNMIIFAN